MTTYLINHLRIPGEIPNAEGLEYLEKVEATFRPYGGQWLVLGQHHEVLEGAWPGSVVLMEFPDRNAAQEWYRSPTYQEILHLRTCPRVRACPYRKWICTRRLSTPGVNVERVLSQLNASWTLTRAGAPKGTKKSAIQMATACPEASFRRATPPLNSNRRSTSKRVT